MKGLYILWMLLAICHADSTTTATDSQNNIIIGTLFGFFFLFLCWMCWMYNYGCESPCKVCGVCEDCSCTMRDLKECCCCCCDSGDCCCTWRELKECCCCCCMDLEIKDYCKRFCCPCLRKPVTQPINQERHENVIQINKVTQIFQQGAAGQPILVSQTTIPQKISVQKQVEQHFTDPVLQAFQRERIAFLSSAWNFYFYSKSQKYEIFDFKFNMSPIPSTSFYRVTSSGSDRKGTFKFQGKYWLEDDNNININMNQNYDNKQAVGQVGQHQTIVWQGIMDSNRNYTGKWYHKGFQMHPDFHGTWELIRIATIDMNTTNITLMNT